MFLLPCRAHHLCWNLALGQVREYAHAMRASTPLPQPPTSASLEAISFLKAFHFSNSSVPCFDFLIQGKDILTRVLKNLSMVLAIKRSY